MLQKIFPVNPFRLAHGLPRRPWLRSGLGLLGLVLLAFAARQVNWRQFRDLFAQLDWTWVLVSLLLAWAATCARALRLTWILGRLSRYGGVLRAVALGYLGKALLPMGAGELVKIGALQTLLEIPAASAAAGAVLDRMLDLVEAAILIALLAGTGVAVQLRSGPLWLAGAALALVILATVLLFRWRARRRSAAAPTRARSWIERTLDPIAEVLDKLKHPARWGRLLAAQAAVLVLDVVGIYVGILAFPFGPALPFMVSVKLSVYLMLGSALPLLPGGAGILQVACLLALQPAGVSSAGAFAYSLVSQGTGLGLAGLQGALAALWPGPPLKAKGVPNPAPPR
jgi:uncharacterized membrane protein YbhN (UPF0104 family)